MPVLSPHFIFNIAGKERAIIYTRKLSDRNVECGNAKYQPVMDSGEILQLQVPISVF